MPKASRVAESSTSTSSAVIVLSGAPLGRRTLASKHTVGETGIELVIEDTAGNWLEGVYTYTSSNPTTMTRTAILSSSNSDADVTFPAGTKTVSETASAAYLNASSAIATTTVLGLVKIGAGLSIATDGTLSAPGASGATGSVRVVYTSSTCTSDSILDATPTVGTDQTVKLQAILDLAANGPLIVIWDGAYSVGGSYGPNGTNILRIRGKTTIRALPGCGAVLLPGQTTQMWRNYNPTIDPNSVVDKDITFEGGVWHGNVTAQGSGRPTLFDFVGVDTLRMLNGVQMIRASGFAWRGTNVYHATLNNFKVDFGAGNTVVSTDGIHFNGPSRFIDISDGELFNCADDCIAFNADDAWGAGTFTGPFDNVYGEISDVSVDGVYLQGYVCGIRLLSGGSRMDRISLKNIKGKTGGYWLVVDNFNGTQEVLAGPGNIGSLEIDGVCMENTPVTGWTAAQAHFNCKIEQLSLRNFTKGKFNNVTYPSILFGPRANIRQATIDGYKSYPFNGGTYLTNQIGFTSGAQIGTMKINNSQFDAPTTTGYPIVVPSGVSISQLSLSGCTGTGFTDFISNAGTITNLHAPTTSNFMDAGPAAALYWTLDQGFTEVSASAVNFTGPINTIQTATKPADTFNSNEQITTRVRFTGTATDALHAAVIARAANMHPYSGSGSFGYVFDVDQIAGIWKLGTYAAAGGGATKATVTAAVAMNSDYDLTCTLKNSALTWQIKRVSDSLYLQPNGSWSATVANAISITDTTFGSGSPLLHGVYAYAYSAAGTVSGVSFSNYAIAAAP